MAIKSLSSLFSTKLSPVFTPTVQTSALTNLVSSSTLNLNLNSLLSLNSGSSLLNQLIPSTSIDSPLIAALKPLLASTSGTSSISITNLFQGLSSSSSNTDLTKIINLVGGLIGNSSTGNLDIAALSKLVGGLIGNSSSSQIDFNQIIGLVGGLIGGGSTGGNIDISKIAQLVSGLIGSNSGSNLDISSIVNLISGLIGGTGGSVDISKIAQLLGSLIGGNSGSNIDIGSIVDIVSGLIGSGASSGNVDISKIAQLLGSLIGGNSSSNIDIGAIVDIVSGLIGGSGSIDISTIIDLIGSLIGGTTLPSPWTPELISSTGTEFDLNVIAKLISGLVNGGSTTEGLDLSTFNNLIGGLIGQSAASDIDISSIIGLIGGLISNSSGGLDIGTIAQSLTQTLMPLLGSIDTGNSSIDMGQLTAVLPSIIGSVTTLVAAISSANSGNIPETIADVLKGVNPLLEILANSNVIDADQAQIVHTVHDVLYAVQTVLDLVSSPSLLTLSNDINNVLSALKPVIALIDSDGTFSDSLNDFQLPDIGQLLGSLTSGTSHSSGLSDLLNDTQDTANDSSFDLTALLQGSTSNNAGIDLSQISTELTKLGNLGAASEGIKLPSFDFKQLAQSFKPVDIDPTHPLF